MDVNDAISKIQKKLAHFTKIYIIKDISLISKYLKKFFIYVKIELDDKIVGK